MFIISVVCLSPFTISFIIFFRLFLDIVLMVGDTELDVGMQKSVVSVMLGSSHWAVFSFLNRYLRPVKTENNKHFDNFIKVLYRNTINKM